MTNGFMGLFWSVTELAAPRLRSFLGKPVARFNIRFNDSRKAALRVFMILHPGRPSAISESIQQNLDAHLRRSPSTFGYSQDLWNPNLLSHNLRKRYQVNVGRRQCEILFHKLGSRLRKSRPLIAKTAPED